MRDRAIHVSRETYERLEQEAGRRGMQLDALVDELLTAALAGLGDADDDADV